MNDRIADGCHRHRLRRLRRGNPAPRYQRTSGHRGEHGTLHDISHPCRNSSQRNEQKKQQQCEQSRLPDKMNQRPTQCLNQGRFQHMQDGEHDNLCCQSRIQEHLKQHSKHAAVSNEKSLHLLFHLVDQLADLDQLGTGRLFRRQRLHHELLRRASEGSFQ